MKSMECDFIMFKICFYYTYKCFKNLEQIWLILVDFTEDCSFRIYVDPNMKDMI